MLESLVLCYTLENEWRHAHPSLGYYLPGLSQVLEGMGSHLESFDVLLIEVSSVELYAGERQGRLLESKRLSLPLGLRAVQALRPAVPPRQVRR